jgi:hypothetical protein
MQRLTLCAAARLETGTHQFGEDLLFSEVIYDMMSPRLQTLWCKIDRVTVKGSVKPISLYTYDVPPCDAKTIEELYKDVAEIDEDEWEFWDYFRPRTSTCKVVLQYMCDKNLRVPDRLEGLSSTHSKVVPRPFER